MLALTEAPNARFESAFFGLVLGRRGILEMEEDGFRSTVELEGALDVLATGVVSGTSSLSDSSITMGVSKDPFLLKEDFPAPLLLAPFLGELG